MYAIDPPTQMWQHYYSLWEALAPAERRVAELVGVSEAYIARAMQVCVISLLVKINVYMDRDPETL